LVSQVRCVRRQPVNQQVFGRCTVPKAIAEIDFNATDAGDPLGQRELGFARLEGTVRQIPLARELDKVMLQISNALAGAVRGVRARHSGHGSFIDQDGTLSIGHATSSTAVKAVQ